MGVGNLCSARAGTRRRPDYSFGRPLPQGDARPLVVLIDEDYAGGLERSADRGQVVRRQRLAAVLKVGDGVAPDNCSARQFGLPDIAAP
jgi:hypothetical protein